MLLSVAGADKAAHPMNYDRQNGLWCLGLVQFIFCFGRLWCGTFQNLHWLKHRCLDHMGFSDEPKRWTIEPQNFSDVYFFMKSGNQFLSYEKNILKMTSWSSSNHHIFLNSISNPANYQKILVSVEIHPPNWATNCPSALVGQWPTAAHSMRPWMLCQLIPWLFRRCRVLEFRPATWVASSAGKACWWTGGESFVILCLQSDCGWSVNFYRLVFDKQQQQQHALFCVMIQTFDLDMRFLDEGLAVLSALWRQTWGGGVLTDGVHLLDTPGKPSQQMLSYI